MQRTRQRKSISVSLWRENDILDFLGVVLLFAACLTVSAFQQ